MEKQIIDLYLSGYGSTTIVKLLSIPKRKVLRVLNDNNLIVKRENPIYQDFKFDKDTNKWYSYYSCDTCLNSVRVEANKKYYLARNLQTKKTCKKCSMKSQTGTGNPFYGKTHTKKTKRKISSKKKGVKTSDHMSTPKYRELLRNMKLELWDSGKMEDVRVKMSRLMKKRISSGELKGYNRSKAEDDIIDMLTNMGIVCEPNYIIEGKIFDIHIPAHNLLIEYNGDYWHCNPRKYDESYINTKKSMTAKEIWQYDKDKLDLANNNGYTCEVIWESDYKRNPDTIKKLINKYEKYT